jgi:hypothetical protein
MRIQLRYLPQGERQVAVSYTNCHEKREANTCRTYRQHIPQSLPYRREFSFFFFFLFLLFIYSHVHTLFGSLLPQPLVLPLSHLSLPDRTCSALIYNFVEEKA